MVTIPKIQLSNGAAIPSIGFGTTATETEKEGDVEQAVRIAIDTGYRYFDTSRLYGNEREISDAFRKKIRDGIVTRKDLFIVNKIGCTIENEEDIEYFCRLSLLKLGLEYLDLYLLHMPYNYRYKGEDEQFPLYSEPMVKVDVNFLKTWQSMEKLVDKGLIKSIGLSNCSISLLKRILETCRIKPVTCHIECCPGFHQKKLIQFCKANRIQITAYCPLSRPDFKKFAQTYLQDEYIQQMGKKYNKTSFQLILRYLYQLGAVPIPKSITQIRIEQYFNIFDFTLTDDEIKQIDQFYKEERNIIMEKALFPRFPLKGKITWKYDD